MVLEASGEFHICNHVELLLWEKCQKNGFDMSNLVHCRPGEFVGNESRPLACDMVSRHTWKFLRGMRLPEVRQP